MSVGLNIVEKLRNHGDFYMSSFSLLVSALDLNFHLDLNQISSSGLLVAQIILFSIVFLYESTSNSCVVDRI